jgi:N-acetylglucosaminyl-diphospho-decaprenol L-rhamnosyltransferase
MRECLAILLHFRSASLTVQCVQSLIAERVDVIVIVDNSEDRGVSLAALRIELGEAVHWVRILEPGRNLGYARGINYALDALPEYHGRVDLLLINNDATFVEGTVSHLRLAVAGPNPVVAAPLIDGPTGLVSARTYYRHVSALITPVGPGLRGHVVLGGACLMVHRELVGSSLFDESFFFYGDDIEFGYRMLRQGVVLLDVQQGTIVHKGSASSRNGSLFYEYHMARAHLGLAYKLSDTFQGRLVLFVGRALFLPLRATVRSFRFRSFRPWTGLGMAVIDMLRGRVRTLTPPAGTSS